MRSDLLFNVSIIFFYRQGTNACSKKPCSHICVPLPGEKFTCLCPDGLKAINNTDDGKISCKCTDGSDELPDGTCAQQDGTCRYVCLFVCLFVCLLVRDLGYYVGFRIDKNLMFNLQKSSNS